MASTVWTCHDRVQKHVNRILGDQDIGSIQAKPTKYSLFTLIVDLSADVSLLLLEKRGGSRFFALQQTFYLVEPRSDKGYLLSILNPIELDMPAVLKSHQITELNEDEMGLALEGWAVFLGQQREDLC
eukprot:s186_g14.t1